MLWCRPIWINWILYYWDILGCNMSINNMWYWRIPAEAPIFHRNGIEWITFLHSRLLQTGLCGPHLREVVILENSTLDSAVSSFLGLIAPMWSGHQLWIDKWSTSDCYLCISCCIKGTPVICVFGNILSLQCSADSYLLCLCPRMLLRLLLWFSNTLITACHVCRITGERMIGSFVLVHCSVYHLNIHCME